VDCNFSWRKQHRFLKFSSVVSFYHKRRLWRKCHRIGIFLVWNQSSQALIRQRILLNRRSWNRLAIVENFWKEWFPILLDITTDEYLSFHRNLIIRKLDLTLESDPVFRRVEEKNETGRENWYSQWLSL